MRAKITCTIPGTSSTVPPIDQSELGLPIKQGTVDIERTDDPRPFHYVTLRSLDCLREIFQTTEANVEITDRVRGDHDPSIDLVVTVQS